MLEFGTIIGGKYCLEEQIAQGGMAIVWRAVHVDLNRPVAVKFLTTEPNTGARDRERFLREARLAASVRHRFVVDTIDFGITDDGQAFIVMELLEGGSLFDWISEDEPRRATDILATISSTLKGLTAVHALGIVHRDLKPENIVLVSDGDEAVFPKIIDFGISRALVPDDLRPMRLTRAGVVMGTVEYMSPEQARGLADVDLRTDIYSIGVMVYECLTRLLPFDDENQGDLLVKIISGGAAPRLSTIRPDLGEPLSRVVERAMSRDRDARYQSAEELREALEAAVRESAETVPGWADARIGVLVPTEGSDVAPVSHSTPTRRPGPTISERPLSRGTKPAPVPAPRLAAPAQVTRFAVPLPARRFGHGVGIALASVLALVLVISTGVGLVAGEPQMPTRSAEATPSGDEEKDDATLFVRTSPAPTALVGAVASMDGRRAAGARTRTSAGELAAREGATGADAAADAAADGPLTGAVEGADRPSTTAAFRDPGF